MVQKNDDSLLARVRIQPYGERGYLLNQLYETERLVIQRATTLNPPEAFGECVVGAENVLLLFKRPVLRCVVQAWLRQQQAHPCSAAQESRCIEVPVVYDGADLADVAARTGLSVEAVIELHTAPTYRVRMMGFTPGFPYLDGLDPRLHLERKASPRDRIEPGAVAIGGSHAGIYSVASPGGWHLLGRTDLPLFCPKRAKGAGSESRDIFALAAGDTVKFRAL